VIETTLLGTDVAMNPPPHLPDDLPKALELHRALGPVMMQTVTPITGSLVGRTDQLGTGAFFRVSGRSFLVTAAHVLEDAKKDNYLLRILDGGATLESQSGCKDVALPKWKAYVGQSPADVAVVPLSDEVLAALPSRRFLGPSEVAVRAARPGGCWVMGFPAESVEYPDARKRMTLKPFLIASPLIDAPPSLDDYDERFHFLLDAQRDQLRWPDGTAAEMPLALHGISGCPVWQVLWPDGRWQPEHARIIGVQIGYFRKRSAVLATHWGAVAALLYEYLPELREEIEQHIGVP
jgi:hypothetical protein